MKISMAQINTSVGDVTGNIERIKQAIVESAHDTDVIIFPEQTTVGYPCDDLLAHDDMIESQLSITNDVQRILRDQQKDLIVILGHVDVDREKQQPGGGMRKYNAASVITQDNIQTYHKQLFSDYDVFYESRHMTRGDGTQVIFETRDGLKHTLTICEDIWDEHYDYKPLEHMDLEGIDTVFNLSSSPFDSNKFERRLDLLKALSEKHGTHFVYLNQVGGQGDTVFDGGSMRVDRNGTLTHLLPFHQEIIHTINTKHKEDVNTAPDVLQRYYDTMILGIRDYVRKSGLEKVVIGVSGGIDSSISLAVLTEVLGPENILAYYLPSRHSTNSAHDAQQLCDNLGVQLHVHSIQSRFDTALTDYRNRHGDDAKGVTYENMQARIRGDILYEYSNETPRSFIINNSNQTEIALGYGTLHGDMVGSLNMLGDLHKTEIYDIAREIINSKKEIIPRNVINKPASAELTDDQVDPWDYNVISKPVEEFLWGKSVEEVVDRYDIDYELAKKLYNRVHSQEFKRREYYPITLKMKKKNIGIGRRYPVVKTIHSQSK